MQALPEDDAVPGTALAQADGALEVLHAGHQFLPLQVHQQLVLALPLTLLLLLKIAADNRSRDAGPACLRPRPFPLALISECGENHTGLLSIIFRYRSSCQASMA